jgi:hypothetical protein
MERAWSPFISHKENTCYSLKEFLTRFYLLHAGSDIFAGCWIILFHLAGRSTIVHAFVHEDMIFQQTVFYGESILTY